MLCDIKVVVAVTLRSKKATVVSLDAICRRCSSFVPDFHCFGCTQMRRKVEWNPDVDGDDHG